MKLRLLFFDNLGGYADEAVGSPEVQRVGIEIPRQEGGPRKTFWNHLVQDVPENERADALASHALLDLDVAHLEHTLVSIGTGALPARVGYLVLLVVFLQEPAKFGIGHVFHGRRNGSGQKEESSSFSSDRSYHAENAVFFSSAFARRFRGVFSLLLLSGSLGRQAGTAVVARPIRVLIAGLLRHAGMAEPLVLTVFGKVSTVADRICVRVATDDLVAQVAEGGATFT